MHKWTDVQRQWIAALKSGRYRQGKERLAWGGRYCCLGVACHVMYGDPGKHWRGSDVALPDHAVEALGMIAAYGHFGARVTIGKAAYVSSLVSANDAGATLPEIADFIEANPEKFFVQEAS